MGKQIFSAAGRFQKRHLCYEPIAFKREVVFTLSAAHKAVGPKSSDGPLATLRIVFIKRQMLSRESNWTSSILRTLLVPVNNCRLDTSECCLAHHGTFTIWKVLNTHLFQNSLVGD